MRLSVGVLALVLAWIAFGCTDPKEVNAAFAQTKVTWTVFDTGRIDGLRPLSGFEQSLKVIWVPRTQAVRATT